MHNPVPAWHLLEVKHTPMHYGALLIFDKPENAPPHYVRDMAETMLEQATVVTPWNLRLHDGWLSRVQPSWETADTVDLDYHFRRSALPAPGGERELGVLVSRLHSHALDMTRPLWECHLIEGLYGDRFAFYIKVHRLLMDATDSFRLMLQALSTEDKDKGIRPMWALAHTAQDLGGLWRMFGADSERASLRDLGQSALGVLRASLQRGNPLRASRKVPRSALNVPITAQRRFATQQYELARLHRLAERLGERVDTIVFYLCGSTLRRFFKEYNALPEDSLVAAVPVDSADIDQGFMHLSLGTRHADPLLRLEEIRRSAARARALLKTASPGLLPSYATLAELPYMFGQIAGGSRWLRPTFNLSMAMLQGPRMPLYLGGARLSALYGMPSLLQGEALSITCLTNAGTLDIGLMGAREALPHLQRMAVYMGQALEDLEALAEQTGRVA